MEGFDSSAKDDIFKAYVKSLEEDPQKYRSDSDQLENACKELSGSLDDLLSEENSDQNLLKTTLMSIADRAKDRKFHYTKFFAIGLFRVLELTGGIILVDADYS